MILRFVFFSVLFERRGVSSDSSSEEEEESMILRLGFVFFVCVERLGVGSSSEEEESMIFRRR